MSFSLEALRAVVRPYVSGSPDVPRMVGHLWPILLDADENSELAESVQDELALHAARAIDDKALIQRLTEIAFSESSPNVEMTVVVHPDQDHQQIPPGKVMVGDPHTTVPLEESERAQLTAA